MNSATFPSATLPNSSVETTFLMLDAKRCSLIASAAPSISREVATRNASSFTMEPSASFSGAPSVMSCASVRPAVTVRLVVAGGSPVKNARTRTTPGGTWVSRNEPSSSEKVSSAVPSTVRRTPPRYSPPRALTTRPSMPPVAAGWATSGLAHASSTPKANSAISFIG